MKRRLVWLVECVHGYESGCSFGDCVGGTYEPFDREAAYGKGIKHLYRSFNPPSDMSINEKQAWREGLQYAAEKITEAMEAAIGRDFG